MQVLNQYTKDPPPLGWGDKVFSLALYVSFTLAMPFSSSLLLCPKSTQNAQFGNFFGKIFRTAQKFGAEREKENFDFWGGPWSPPSFGPNSTPPPPPAIKEAQGFTDETPSPYRTLARTDLQR